VALDLAKKLKSILETQGGFEVFLTRETDVTLPLEKEPNWPTTGKPTCLSPFISTPAPGKPGLELKPFI